MYENGTVEGEIGTRLDEYLTRIVSFGFSGACLLATEGRIVLNKGYGMAIRAENILNTSETVFCTGSITKQFTAAAILKLEMQGKLKTSDPLTNHFSNVPKDKANITIHNLLTHTSGIVDSVGDDYEETDRDETVQKTLSAPLIFKPGEQYEYSNAGYSLLGAIIELTSGQPYEAYLNKQLFSPSGMNHTGYRLPNWSEKTVAHWYVGDTDNLNSLHKPFPYWNIVGNGGILSTLEDMHKWQLSIKNNLVLSAAAKKKLFTPFLQDYAYGWSVTKTQHGALIHHDGANDLGASADFKWFPDHDTVIIMFFNQDYEHIPIMSQVRIKAEKLAFGETVQAPPKVLETEVSNITELVGEYTLEKQGEFRLTMVTGAIELTANGQDAVDALFPDDRSGSTRRRELNQKTATLLKAATKGDYSVLEKEVEDPTTLDRKRRFIADTIKKAETKKPSIEIEVIGTMPFPRKEGTDITLAQLNCGSDKIPLGLVWHDGKLWGVTPQPDRATMLFRPTDAQTLAGYHIGLARNVEIRFNTDNKGSVTELIIQGKKDTIRARKREHTDNRQAPANQC